MKSRKLATFFYLVLLLGIGNLLWGCSTFANTKNEVQMPMPGLSDESKLTSQERNAVDFLQGVLQMPEGIIVYSANLKSPADYGMSESMGQVMEYAALLEDWSLFDYYATVTDKFFHMRGGYYTWKLLVEKHHGEKASALVDDLRITKAYLIADRRQPQNGYRNNLESMSKMILSKEVDADGFPCDFYDAKKKEQADFVSLFYLDTKTMESLIDIDHRWEKTYRKAQKLLIDMPENENGFYPHHYLIAKEEYQWSDTINMVENLYTAIDALEAGRSTAAFQAFLKNQIQQGKIFNHYDMAGGPADTDESTAVYALAARFLYFGGEMNDAEWCYNRMLRFQIEQHMPLAGGFGDGDSGLVYAFDQLEALLTIRMVEMKDVE